MKQMWEKAVTAAVCMRVLYCIDLMLPCLLSVHYRVYDRVVNKECEIRIGGSCAFDDQFGVHEANVGEAVSTAICMLGTLLY
jgi:hypothetical protein